MREVGVNEPNDSSEPSNHADGTPLHVCWAGVHTPRKALNLLIQALPLCKQNIHLNVLGDGPCSPNWQKLARKLEVDHLVTFHGKIPHHQVFDIMSQSHVFCISSLSEGGTPNIVMEALQQGLPIIALNHCAFASVVNDSCGIKIDINSTRQIIQDFAAALDKLASDESMRRILARGAFERSKQYTWKTKAEILDCLYREATCNSRTEKQ